MQYILHWHGDGEFFVIDTEDVQNLHIDIDVHLLRNTNTNIYTEICPNSIKTCFQKNLNCVEAVFLDV